MKKQKIKNIKGITLIALVITIIILLILVGISIVGLSGENGLINQTIIAKQKTEYAYALEIINLKIQEANIDSMSNKKRNCTIDELADYMGRAEDTEVVITKYYELASVEGSLVKPEKIKGFLVKAERYLK